VREQFRRMESQSGLIRTRSNSRGGGGGACYSKYNSCQAEGFHGAGGRLSNH
jgi:hypothetical protein